MTEPDDAAPGPHVRAATSLTTRTTALLLTADDAIFDAVATCLASDGAIRALRRERTLEAARTVVASSDVVVVLADPRVGDADPAEVATWLREIDAPTLLLLPDVGATNCLRAVSIDLAFHVVVPGAPRQLLVTSVHRAIEAHREETALAGRYADWRDRLAVVRHEMATPLGAIEGFLEALLAYGENLPAARRRDSLEAAHRNVGRLRRLVSELNAAAKATGPAAATNLSMIELHPVLTRLVRDLGPRADDVHVLVPKDTWALVDHDHLDAVVGNLIDNAFKYGTAPIEVRARVRDGRVQIAVIDHGEGVPEHFVPHMFERYTRAEEVRDRRRGSGIGLSLCAELADAMGGRLRYERGEHGGSIFVLEVLATREGTAEEPAAPAPDVIVDIAAAERERDAEAAAATDEVAAAETVEAEAGDGAQDPWPTLAPVVRTREDLPAYDALAYGPAEIAQAVDEALENVAPEARRTWRRPVAGELEITRDGMFAHTTVGLGYEGRDVEGHASGAATTESSTRAVVRATLDAVEAFLDGAAQFDVERVRIDGEDDDQHVTVTLTVMSADGFERLLGAALTNADPQRAAMYATLDALNRRIERLLV